MCIEADFSKVKEAKRDMYAWKIVRQDAPGIYKSWMWPNIRERQRGYRNDGQVIIYRKGDVSKSPFDTTPGLYCFELKKDAVAFADDVPKISRVIKVCIPKGTHYVRGAMTLYRDRRVMKCICAEALSPV